MAELAKAYVQIIPSFEGGGSAISSMLSNEAGNAGDDAGEEAGQGFSGKLKAVIAAAGIGVAVKKAFDAASASAKYLDEIDKTSQKLGIQADQYQALSFAAQHCGFSTSVYNTAVKKLQSSNYNGTLVDYLDSLMKVDDVSKRTAMAQEMLGSKVANEMAPFLNGTQTMSDYYNQLDSLGGLMSNEAVTAGASFEDAMTDLNTAMTGIRNTTFAQFLPSLSEVINGTARLIAGDGGGFQQIANGAVEFSKTLLSSVMSAITNVLNAISTNGPTFIAKGFELLKKLLVGFLDNLPQVIATVGTIISNFVSALNKNMPTIRREALSLLTSVASSLIKNLPKIIASIVKAIFQIFKSTNWFQLGMDIIKGIVNGFSGAGNIIKTAINNVGKSMVKGIKGFFGIHSPSRLMQTEVGQYITLGLAEGITSKQDDAVNAMDQVSSATFGAVNSGSFINNSNDVIALLQQLVSKDQNIYLDSGELVGGISSKMDRSLGNLRLKGARGG